MAVLLGRRKAVRLAGGSVSSVKWSVYTWGLIRWAVYAAVFYIGYKFGGGRAAGVVGAAAGLAIPLVVVIYTGATEVATEVQTKQNAA
jgi:threonine/homoserine efflux transporter RhtA